MNYGASIAIKSGRRFGAPIVGVLVAGALSACDPAIESAGALKHLPDVAGPGSAEPHLASTDDGRPVLSWLETDDEGSILSYSVLDDNAWATPVRVAAGDDWFVNWADFPSVVPIDDSLWAAHWLRKRPGTSYSYDVVMAVSTDSGRSWAEPVTPHLDDTATEHGFVSLFPWLDGVGALWLDGRNMTGPDHDAATGSENGMTLRSAVITPDGEITRSQLADELVCDCCQTDVALADAGPVAVYRNRTADEIRDIYVARSTNGMWMDGAPVADDGWNIAGCPVNGPAIAAEGSRAAVAWFTAAGNHSRVRVAFSNDGGASFGTPIDVDAAQPIGRVGVVYIDGDDVLVSWMADAGSARGNINAMRVSASGSKGNPVTIGTTTSGRLSGFPQMVASGSNIIFAWTDTAETRSVVRTAVAPRQLFQR